MADNTMVSTTDVISAAIAEQVRALGGDAEAIDNISHAASYAVICWSLAAAERGQGIPREPINNGQSSTEGKGKTCAA